MKGKKYNGSEIERHKLYGTWVNMKCRCYVVGSNRYENYGGRGIKVCDRWLEPGGEGFRNFVADMGDKPPDPDWWTGIRDYYSLDRIDSDGDYEPSNCRWATVHQQQSNKQGTNDSPNVYWDSNYGGWQSSISINGKRYRKRSKDKKKVLAYLERVKNEYGI